MPADRYASYRYDAYGYDTSGSTWTSTPTATTTVTMVYRPGSQTYAADATIYAPDLEEDWALEPLNKVASREAHKWAVRRSREKSPAPLTTRARHGFQQMARVPCYRGARTR